MTFRKILPLLIITLFTACAKGKVQITPIATQVPSTATASPTNTLTPTPTSTPTVTPTPSCRDQEFEDLTLPGIPQEGFWRNTLQPEIVFDFENHEVFQKSFHNRKLTVAIENGFMLSDKFSIDHWNSNEELADFVFNTWAIYWKEFGGTPFESFTVVFGNDLSFEGGSYALGFGMSNPYSSWIAHEIYHTWNGNAFRQKDERSWYLEGVTTYYGDIRQSNNGFEIMMKEFINYYLDYYEQGKDRAIGDMSMNDTDYDHQFMAQKGAVIAYLLDNELSKIGHNIGEVSRRLYENFGIHPIGAPSNEQILAIVNEVSGKDFSEFFERYITGSEKLPVSRSQDVKWICHDVIE